MTATVGSVAGLVAFVDGLGCRSYGHRCVECDIKVEREAFAKLADDSAIDPSARAVFQQHVDELDRVIAARTTQPLDGGPAK